MHRRREEIRGSIFGIITVEKPNFGRMPIVLYVAGAIDVRGGPFLDGK
jgi:hypothetical protein